MELNTKLIAGILVIIVSGIGGTTYYLTLPTEEPLTDLCSFGGTTEQWYNTSPVFNINENFTATGRYRCDVENSDQFCYKLSPSKKTCYLLTDAKGQLVKDMDYTNDNEGYIYSEDSLSWSVDNYFDILIDNPISRGVTNCNIVNLTSHLNTQSIDLAFQFDENLHIYDRHVYVLKSMDHSVPVFDDVEVSSDFTCDNDDYVIIDATWFECDWSGDPECENDLCSYLGQYTSYVNNGADTTFTWTHTENQLVSYDIQTYPDFDEITHLFSKFNHNGHNYYYISNNMVQDKEYSLKFCYSTSPNTESQWHIFVKRSVDNLQDAISKKRYMRLV